MQDAQRDATATGLNPTVVVLKLRNWRMLIGLRGQSQSNRSGFETSGLAASGRSSQKSQSNRSGFETRE